MYREPNQQAMINRDDLSPCIDCNRKMAQPPATVCDRCQSIRLKAMMEIYHAGAITVQNSRRNASPSKTKPPSIT